jgi:phosphoribosyl 1,2-cyclic phosphodiesterase
MKLTFIGTRGNTKLISAEHQRHSSMLVNHAHRTVMIDCGADWRELVWRFKPSAIVLTHAHPDHAWGLRDGSPCPVHATSETMKAIERFPLDRVNEIRIREVFEIDTMQFEAFRVEHSTLAPAVGYRITADCVSAFYVPDVVYIHDRNEAMAGVRLYVGDGATLTRSMVRRRDDALIGHVPIRTQLTWCHDEGVERAVFTHCGTEIIKKGLERAASDLNALALERKVHAEFALDGAELVLRPR